MRSSKDVNQSRFPFRTALLASALLPFLASTVYADGAPPEPQEKAVFTPLQDFRESYYTLIDRESQIEFAVGVSTILGSTLLDPSIQADFRGYDRWGHLEPLGNNVLGTGVPGAIVGLGLWGVGLGFQLDHEIHAGAASCETLLTAFVFTMALKSIVQRQRPDGSDTQSFPSGHTSTVAASATVLSEFYGWKIGIPAFALVAITAEGRWSTDRHWFSDTVAGAALGAFIGQGFSRAHLKHLAPLDATKAPQRTASWTWSTMPFFQDDGGGMVLRVEL